MTREQAIAHLIRSRRSVTLQAVQRLEGNTSHLDGLLRDLNIAQRQMELSRGVVPDDLLPTFATALAQARNEIARLESMNRDANILGLRISGTSSQAEKTDNAA